ncbi:MAG: LPS export ABC transporter periplasmic protein LptC [Candidatus Omnitrophota bacterium]
MRFQNTKYTLVYVFIVLISLSYLCGCSNNNTIDSKYQDDKLLSSEDKIMSFNLAGFTETGKKKWEVEGESANILDNIVNLTNIIGKAYGQEIDVKLTADEGTFNRSTNDVHLQKNVVVVTTEGTRLTTDTLNWDAQNQIVKTDDTVKIEKENLEAIGKGGEAHPQLKQAQLKAEVMVNVKPNTVITCKGPLEVDYENNIAVFHNDVKVADIKGDIYADEITAYFDPKNKKIEKAIAIGNVRIIRGNNCSFSQKAEYYALTNKVVLTGEPKVELYPKGSQAEALPLN